MRQKVIRALLVEDNPDDVVLMKEMVAGDPEIELSFADSMAEALGKLSEPSYDVIVLDLTLPDSAAGETLGKLFRHASDLPIVVVTQTQFDSAAAEEAVQQGAQDYLYKDQLTPVLLQRSIRYAIERHSLRRGLKKHAQEMGALFNALTDPVLIVDERGIIRFANRTAADLFDKPTEQLVGKPFKPKLNPGQHDNFSFRGAHGELHGQVQVVQVTWEGAPALMATFRDVHQLSGAHG